MGYLKETVKGFSWMGGLRASTRIISFIRIAILARLLTPNEFGLFGIAGLILAFLEIFTQTGINVFLIQEGRNYKKYIDTAWIVSIFRGFLIALVILLSASPVSIFFKTPQAYSLLLLIALAPLIKGFINPSIIKFRKDLIFNKEFILRFFLFFVDSLTAIILAFITKSASSMIWGLIVAAVFEVIISFMFIKPKPRFAFEFVKAKKIIGRGKWVTVSGVFTYLSQQGDDAVVARILDSSLLGLYQVAYKISTLPLTEISDVARGVTFPVFSKISRDSKSLKKAFSKTAMVLCLLIIPFGFLIYLFPKEIISVILGSKWIEAVPVLKVLALFGVVSALIEIPNSLFLSLKMQKDVAFLQMIRFVGLAMFIIPLTGKMGIVGAAYASIISVFLTFPFVIHRLRLTLR